ncbi:hypothetical protein JI435_302650, partial [Parastagonospora nodorum SN15]
EDDTRSAPRSPRQIMRTGLGKYSQIMQMPRHSSKGQFTSLKIQNDITRATYTVPHSAST